jgi:hypothetical protein
MILMIYLDSHSIKPIYSKVKKVCYYDDARTLVEREYIAFPSVS